MPNPREQQLRNNRRLARQFVGAIALVLAVIGLFTVIGWVATMLRIVTDDTEERQAYEEKLYGLVMFDVLPFEDAAQVDPGIFRQAAIWGTLYQIQNRDGNFDNYERDPDSGSIVLPSLEVNTYLTNLLGSDYVVEDSSFETSEFLYTYSEELQGYLVPITGSVGLYMPKVDSISVRGGRTYVTVGYIPTFVNSNDLMLTIPTDPTKYMDYIFERGANHQLCLTALQESEKQPAQTPAPTEEPLIDIDPQALVQDNLGSDVGDAIAPPEEGAASQPASSAAAEEGTEGEPAPETPEE